MEILEKLRQFLLGFSGWEGSPSADFTEDGPGCTGLFPVEQERVAQRRDLLGNVQVDMRCRFALYNRMLPGQDGAAWLLEFEKWLCRENIAGRAPRFGDVPELEKLYVKKAAFQESSRLTAGLCTVTLVAEFTKEYMVKEVAQ